MGLDPISWIAIGGLAVSGASAYQQNKYAKQSAAAQRESAEFQRKQANLQNARQRRDAIRTARLAYGQSAQAAANQGVSGSSSSMGGLGSIQSQLRDNVSFLDQYGFYSDQASRALGRANEAGSRAQTWGAIGGLGMTAFQNADRIAGVFGGE